MRKSLTAVFVVSLAVYFMGCAKKQSALEESAESLSMEEFSQTASSGTQVLPEQAAPKEALNLEPVPPGPYRPTAKEIQSALKNAGFYSAEIDGKAGPMTRKAAEEFQKANGLKADGKVGPKTWEVLSKYLNPPAPAKKKR